ncbi:MAG: TonB C-terminal domain-containing protein [Candidatus Adiutrix sp.]|jgi:colicin import membrane protein|nr:TonB C-terminal domain-containing protein [Candidatus Adiutrix sp.]
MAVQQIKRKRPLLGLWLGLALSLILHLLLIGWLVHKAGEKAAAVKPPPEVIRVELVPAPQPAPEPEAKAPAPKPQPRPPAQRLIPKGDSSLPQLPMEKKRAAPPQVQPPEVKPDRPKESLSGQPLGPRQVAPAPEPPKRPLSAYEMMTRTLGRDAANLQLGSARGNVADPLISRYYSLIMLKIKSNWHPATTSPQFRLAANYTIVIEPSGRIARFWKNQSSGDQNYDRAVEEAIQRSSPLPPLPSIFGGRPDSPAFFFVRNSRP